MMLRQPGRTNRTGDVRADRVVLQPVFACTIRPLGLYEQLHRAAGEVVTLDLASAARHDLELVERQRLAGGAQDPQAVRDDRIDCDALPHLGDLRLYPAWNFVDSLPRRAALLRAKCSQLLAQLHGMLD